MTSITSDDLHDALLCAIQIKNIPCCDALLRQLLALDESDHELLNIGYNVCNTKEIELCQTYCEVIASDKPEFLTQLYQYSAKSGYITIVQWLLTRYAGVIDVQDNNNYALRWACRHGHVDVVKYLLISPDLKVHADIQAMNFYGYQMACSHIHNDVVRFLLSEESGCSIPIQETPYDMRYWFAQYNTDMIECALNMVQRTDPLAYIEECAKYEMWCIRNDFVETYVRYINTKRNDVSIVHNVEEYLHV